VLATPGPPQLTILGHLEHDDKWVAVKGSLARLLAGEVVLQWCVMLHVFESGLTPVTPVLVPL
jgi:hypothetical protein